MQLKRQTAYKFWIRDVLNSQQKLTNEGLRYFQVKDKETIRVNFIAAVINKYVNDEKRYIAITLDDGSGQIRLKAWEEDTKLLSNVEIGEVILTIGRLYEMNSEIFLRPEIVKKMQNSWALVRRYELEKDHGRPIKEERSISITVERIDEKIELSVLAREKVYSMVGNAPDEGIEISNLIMKSGLKEQDVERAIEELLREGEIFNPRPGFVKLV